MTEIIATQFLVLTGLFVLGLSIYCGFRIVVEIVPARDQPVRVAVAFTGTLALVVLLGCAWMAAEVVKESLRSR